MGFKYASYVFVLCLKWPLYIKMTLFPTKSNTDCLELTNLYLFGLVDASTTTEQEVLSSIPGSGNVIRFFNQESLNSSQRVWICGRLMAIGPPSISWGLPQNNRNGTCKANIIKRNLIAQFCKYAKQRRGASMNFKVSLT